MNTRLKIWIAAAVLLASVVAVRAGTTVWALPDSLIGGTVMHYIDAATNFAQPVKTTQGLPVTLATGANMPVTKHLVSSTLTKIVGAGTYSATSTAPQAICLFNSVTACAPPTVTVSSTVAVNGNVTGLKLVKSTTGATGATFRVFIFQTAPTLTSIFNASTYLAPIADITSGAYVGSWECQTATVNSDNSYYDCSPNEPSGNNGFSLSDGTLRFLVTTTGAYVSGSSETFTVVANMLTNVP